MNRWTRWKDRDPSVYAFDWEYIWVRDRKNRRGSLLRVRWVANPGRLEPLPFEPPYLKDLFLRKVGWWAPCPEYPQE